MSTTQYPRRSVSGPEAQLSAGVPVCVRPRSKVKQWLLGFVSGESNPGRRTWPGLSCLERGGGARSSQKKGKHRLPPHPPTPPPSRVVGAGAKSPRTDKSGFCTNTKGPSERIAARIPRPRCQGLASTEQESNKRSASRVMRSKPCAQREGEALMNS